MSELPDIGDTSRLLGELDLVIEQSNLVREIVKKSVQLRNIEQITGPSKRTEQMRHDIAAMEARLQYAHDAAPGISPAAQDQAV